MAWTNSKVFSAFLTDSLNSTASFNVDADNLKAALFNDTITPSQSVTSANTAYGAGSWATGGVSDATGWPAVGRQLLSVSSAFAVNIYTLDAADTVSANSTTTLTNAFGTLIYNDTLAAPVGKQGLCYLYFGGAQGVTNGQFTLVWHGSGLISFTL